MTEQEQPIAIIVKSYDNSYRKNFMAYLRTQDIETPKRCWVCHKTTDIEFEEKVKLQWSTFLTDECFNFRCCKDCKNGKLFLHLLKKDLEVFQYSSYPKGAYLNWIAGNIVERV